MNQAEILSKCSLFRDFTETGLQILSSIAVPKEMPAGSPIFVENMVGDSLFVIGEGAVSIKMQDETGVDREMAMLGPGESFGELSLVVQAPRMVSALAATDVRLLEIRQRDFANLQRQKPQACLKLIIAISETFAAHLQENRQTLREKLLA